MYTEQNFSTPFFNNGYQYGMALSNFFLGFFFARVIIKFGNAKNNVIKSIIRICCITSCAISFYLYYGKEINIFGLEFVANLFIWCPLILATYDLKYLNFVFNGKVKSFIGSMSFAIYVWHAPIHHMFDFILHVAEITSANPKVICLIYNIVLLVVAAVFTALIPFINKLIIRFSTKNSLPNNEEKKLETV